MSNPDSKHILMHLKELCPLITNEHLAESNSYILLLSVIGGETFIVVANSMDSGVPFLKIWNLLSSLCPQKDSYGILCLTRENS